MNPPPFAPTYDSEEPSDARSSAAAAAASARAAPSTSADARSTALDDASARARADRELVHRMAAGDERALGALYDRWVSLVHSLVTHLLRDALDAEEVVEETFWQAWRQAPRYEESRGAVSTWLSAIARSRALDRLRARRRRPEDTWSALGESEREPVASATVAPDPLADAEQRERRRLIAAALARLPAEQRETIELAYFGGFSQSEIAERTGQPLGTVKTRVRLAMEKLREALAMYAEGAR